jgi:uncharacterized membrane protein YfhO
MLMKPWRECASRASTRAASPSSRVRFRRHLGVSISHPCEFVDYAPERVMLETSAHTDAFLVTSETYYPGWWAAIDGRPAPLLMTNGAFRGLAVPAGAHTIEMRFEPAILRWSALISAAAATCVLIALKWESWRTRRFSSARS